ncbi:MAG: right-handed parallel beta-helix repeat-containing protein [Myxococcota bacterium]|nr:right-handed parallel beta-helix repeat-containing protein [Myxococcota bacterium]
MILFLSITAFAADVDIAPEDAAEISSAISLLNPGDTLRFTGGTYDVTGWSFNLQGEEGNPIKITAAEGSEFIIRANEEGAFPRGMNFTESSYLEIENIRLTGDTGWDADGISFEGMRFTTVTDITLKNVHVSQTAGASLVFTGDSTRIFVEESSFSYTRNATPVVIGCHNLGCYVTDVTFQKNLIHDNADENHDLMYVYDGTQNAVITDNVLFNSVRNGITMGHPDNGDTNYIERNAIWNVENAGFVGRGPMIFRNNIIFNTGNQGIYFSNPDTIYEGIAISFNTVVNTGNWGVELRDWYNVTGNVFSNNAICNPVGDSVYFQMSEDIELETSGHTISNNLLCGAVENLREDLGHFLLGYGFYDFTDVEGWDFYPVSGSMLLDNADPAGENYIPQIDFNGVQRDGSGPEIGAYEWSQESNPGWQIQEGFKTYDLKSPISEEVISEGCCQNNSSPEKALLLLPLCIGFGLRRRRNA